MTTIVITDIPADDPIPHRRLRDHLKSDDFFSVDKYPKAWLYIKETNIVDAHKLRATATLTIKGATNPVSFVIDRTTQNASPTYSAYLTIDRFKWKISYQDSYWK